MTYRLCLANIDWPADPDGGDHQSRFSTTDPGGDSTREALIEAILTAAGIPFAQIDGQDIGDAGLSPVYEIGETPPRHGRRRMRSHR